MPESKASRSMVALSVSTSARMSPDLTASPSFLSHFTKVPSVIEGLSRGMIMSLAIRVSGERFAGFQFDKLRGELVLRQFFFESFRRAGRHSVPRAPMSADGELRFEQAQRVGGLLRAHGIKIADGQDDEVGLVKVVDDFHVHGHGGVAGVVNSEAIGEAKHVADGETEGALDSRH